MTEVAQLVTTKSDKEIAVDLRDRLHVALAPVLALLDEGFANGLVLQYTCAMGPFGRHVVQGVAVVKNLA